MLLLGGIALRKVEAVSFEGGRVKVTSQPAALTDAIEHGRLRFHGHQSFPTDGTLRTDLPGTGVSTLAGKTTVGTKFSGKMGEWAYSFDAKATAEKLKLEPTVERSIATVDTKLEAGLELDRPELDGDIEIDAHHTDRADLAIKDLKGKVTAKWSAGLKEYKDDPALAQILSLPVDYPIPILLPLPFFLRIQANFAVVFGLVGEGTRAQGSVTLTSDGEGGYAMSHEEAVPFGKALGHVAFGEETDVQAVGDSVLGIVVNLPRIGFSVGVPKVAEMLYYQSYVFQVTTKASGLVRPLPCKGLDYKMTVSQGFEGKVLGLVDVKRVDAVATLAEGTKRVPEGRTCGD